MGAPRRWAAALLRAAVRLVPGATREWASAMLRELDFIPGDWAALFWALGSTAALFRHAAAGWRNCLRNRKGNEEERMNSTGKKAIGFVSGLLSAFLLVLCAFGVLSLADYLFPGLHLPQLKWPHFLGMIVIPEIIFITAAIMLWRKRGAVAAGILLFALLAGAHVAVYYATH